MAKKSGSAGTKKTSGKVSRVSAIKRAASRVGAGTGTPQEEISRDARSEEERKSALLAALVETLGIALFACKRVDVNYEEYLAWRREDAEFARQVELIEERALDFVEGKAFEEIKKGNARLIQFFLQTKGRARGYARESANEKTSKTSSPLEFLTADELEY